MIAALAGVGLSVSAGLNAFIPLVTMGLLGRYTDLLTLPPGWEWLSNGWVLAVFTVLLVVDFLGDKVPLADHVLDLFHTVVRPTAGGISFSTGFGSQTLAVDEVTRVGGTTAVGVFLIGLLIALAVHLTKALLRGIVNFTTAGLAAPVVSSAEDAAAVALSFSAVLIPVGVLVILAVMALALRRLWRSRRRRPLQQADQRLQYPRRFDP